MVLLAIKLVGTAGDCAGVDDGVCASAGTGAGTSAGGAGSIV